MGSLAYKNWQAASSGVQVASAFEYPLFSDCEIKGEIASGGFGPYELFNAATDERSGTNAVRAFLRVTIHSSPYVDDLVDPGSEHDHGGLIQDEIAALLSLCLGTRIKAGPSTRIFQPNRDQRGRPHAFLLPGEAIPVLSTSSRAPIVPNVLQPKNFEEVELLFRFPKLSPVHSVAVARAARLYQDALWIVDSEPELSWLMLVTAVETAAASWDQERESNTETLLSTQIGRKLLQLLQEKGQEELLPAIADVLVPSTGSTRKFKAFLTEFRPPAPKVRPEEDFRRISWEESNLRRAFAKIYEYRSNALHNGTPFPGPMSWPPTLIGDGLHERLVGGRAGSRGTMWDTETMPMLLWTFEYIVRNALQAWWRRIATDDEAATLSNADGLPQG